MAAKSKTEHEASKMLSRMRKRGLDNNQIVNVAAVIIADALVGGIDSGRLQSSEALDYVTDAVNMIRSRIEAK